MKNRKQFNPFDRVLVRLNSVNRWECDFYSHYVKNHMYPHRTFSFRVRESDIIPYEGNESLLGTTNEPEEKIKLEEKFPTNNPQSQFPLTDEEVEKLTPKLIKLLDAKLYDFVSFMSDELPIELINNLLTRIKQYEKDNGKII